MDKKLALLGAISAISTLSAAESALAREAADVLSPGSYSELLQPISNATNLLKAADLLQEATAPQGQERTQIAQYGYGGWGYHHHHHHHHRYWRRWRWHHHHHHHHHHNYWYGR